MKTKYTSPLKNAMALFAICSVLLFSSCKKYLDTEFAPNLLDVDKVFSQDGSATSAIIAMYSYFPATGAQNFNNWMGAISSDDMQYNGTDAEFLQFAQNSVLSLNAVNENNLWKSPYTVIAYANNAIDGITKSSSLSPAVKNQLLGEARFMRAFIYFHLVNFYGAVPLALDPVAINNASIPRSSTADVYTQMITDLTEAQALLPTAYAGTAASKVRVNKWAATALLARVYLYHQDYANSEAQATQVIASGMYTMPALANTFINTSPETILQLFSTGGFSAIFGQFRTASSGPTENPPIYTVTASTANSFESGDQRKSLWLDSTLSNSVKYYRANKYKLLTATAGNEYSVVFRLAEQYLIRAEARAQQGKIADAQADLNVVRIRAGLGNTSATLQPDLLDAVYQERRVELFSEWSHRWFDLKRTGQVNTVMSAFKNTWKTTSALLPIPQNQVTANENLLQNPGY